MFNEIDFSKIDTSITPPQDDTERQYYYMAKLAEMVALRERELGRRLDLRDRKQRMRML